MFATCVASAAAPPSHAATVTSRFVASTPCRLADVRDGTGFERVDGEIVRIIVTGRCGVPADATAVALTVAVDNGVGGAGGHVTIWPEGQPIPTASIINFAPGQVRANGTVVAVGVGGAIDLQSLGGAPVIVDVTGWFVPATTATAGRFVAVAPTRAIDTRTVRAQPLAPGETIGVPLPPGVPSDAVAVALTVTITLNPGVGFVTAYPQGTTRPLASMLNTDRRNQTRASGAIVAVSPHGIELYTLAGGHLIVDVTGWFTSDLAPADDDGLFVALPAPRRLLDTRSGDPVWANGEREITNIDATAAALVLNAAIVNPLRAGHLTLHPARQALPLTSNVNAGNAVDIAASLAIIPTSQLGVGVFASHGADAVVDVSGWFVGTPGAAPGPAPTNVRPPDCTTTTDPDGLNAFFRGGVAFTGADYQRAFTLPDGRVLWLFQDVFVRGRSGSSRMVHNAGLVQSGTCFTILQTGDYARPGDYLFADATVRQRRWFWPMSGAMGADGLFHVLVAEMRENGASYLSYTEPIATWNVALDPTTLQVVDRRPAINASAALYGWSVTSDASYTYLYAHCHRQFGWDVFPFSDPPVYVHDWDCADEMRVARVPLGRFDLPLAYWNGSTWGTDPSRAVNIVTADRLVSAGQVYFVDGRFVAITKVGDWWGNRIEVDVATRPQGPFTTVRTIPTPPRCTTCNTYFASLLPYPGSDGSMLVGLSNNVFGSPDLARYDPTFFAMPRL